MKKIILSVSALVLAFSLSSAFAQDEPERVVLVKEKLLSKDSYLIVARGYPKEGSPRPVDSAKDAAVFNAQLLAKERFEEGFDVFVNGKAAKFTVREDSVDVNYVLTFKNIKYYLKKK